MSPKMGGVRGSVRWGVPGALRAPGFSFSLTFPFPDQPFKKLPTKAPTRRPPKVSTEVPMKSVLSSGRASPVLFAPVLFLDQRRTSGTSMPSLGVQVLALFSFIEAKPGGGFKPGCFPLFSGKVQIVSRTLSGPFLVGALNRLRKRKRTNGKIPGPSASKSGKSQKNRESPKKDKKGQKRTKKDKKGRTSPDREAPPFETPPFSGP